MTLEVARLDPSAILPTRAYEGDAGLDLYAAHAALLAPGERASIGEQPGAHVHSPPPFRGRTYAGERPGRQAALARSRSSASPPFAAFATEIGDLIEALE